MDLFGLDGMFLISFGFLCIFFWSFRYCRDWFWIVHKDFFAFWVFLSFLRFFLAFLGTHKKFVIYSKKLLLFIRLFSSFNLIEDLFWFCASFLWILKILWICWGLMDLFGLYGRFLIRFRFLCIFFGFFDIVKIDFGSFIKILWNLGFC